MQADLSNMKKQLLKDFKPDDIYPLRAQMVAETSEQIGSKELAEVVLWPVMLSILFGSFKVISLCSNFLCRLSNQYSQQVMTTQLIHLLVEQIPAPS